MYDPIITTQKGFYFSDNISANNNTLKGYNISNDSSQYYLSKCTEVLNLILEDKTCNMMVNRRALNRRNLATAQCAMGVERKHQIPM